MKNIEKGTLETIRRIDEATFGPIYCSYNVLRYAEITRVCRHPVVESVVVFKDSIPTGAYC